MIFLGEIVQQIRLRTFGEDIISASEFDQKMGTMLQTLATLAFKKELPNKVYNSQTLIPVNYGQLEKQEEIGWSAIDLGRMAIWLKIVGTKYPQWRSQTEKVWESWDVKRLTRNGQMYGTSVVKGKEQYNQEGRLGYENYAAYGLKLWGLDVKSALAYQANTAYANLYGQGIPYGSTNSMVLESLHIATKQQPLIRPTNRVKSPWW